MDLVQIWISNKVFPPTDIQDLMAPIMLSKKYEWKFICSHLVWMFGNGWKMDMISINPHMCHKKMMSAQPPKQCWLTLRIEDNMNEVCEKRMSNCVGYLMPSLPN